MITKTSSAKLLGVWAAWHQRSSWAHPRARIQSSGCHAVLRFSPAKTMISADNTVDLLILVVFLVFLRARHVLSCGAASLSVFVHFLLTGTWPKSCLGATSVLNEFFRIGVEISLTTGCRYTRCPKKNASSFSMSGFYCLSTKSNYI